MLHQLINFERDRPFILACSGGVDSMAIADFYRRGGKKFLLAYFNHGTPQANDMEMLVFDYAVKHKVDWAFGKLSDFRDKEKHESPEEYWRNARYEWLNEIADDRPIVTAHHLDDAVETWIFSALHGNPKIPRVVFGNVHRPFLTNEKSQFIDWCVRNEVAWLEDKSNQDEHYPRNRIRNKLLQECFEINPGLKKVIRKKILAQANVDI